MRKHLTAATTAFMLVTSGLVVPASASMAANQPNQLAQLSQQTGQTTHGGASVSPAPGNDTASNTCRDLALNVVNLDTLGAQLQAWGDANGGLVQCIKQHYLDQQDVFTRSSWGYWNSSSSYAGFFGNWSEALLRVGTGTSTEAMRVAGSLAINAIVAAKLRGDVTALSALLGRLPDLTRQDEYKPLTWPAYATAYLAAAAAVRPGGNADLDQEGVDKLATDLLMAFSTLEQREPDPLDKGWETLQAAIAAAQSFQITNYSQISWTRLQAALTQATALTTDASIEQIRAASVALLSAIGSLEPSNTSHGTVDAHTVLQSLIDLANSLKADAYTPESWAELQVAVTDAQAVAGNSAATDAQTKAAISKMLDAVGGLVAKNAVASPDGRALLNDLLSYIRDQLQQNDYTPASWADLQYAIGVASQVVANPNATPQQIQDALKALVDAINMLVTVPGAHPGDSSRELLGALIATASGYQVDDWTSASWRQLMIALGQAQDAANNPSASPSEITAAAKGLIDAITGLVPTNGAGHQALVDMWDRMQGLINGLNQQDYSAGSWAELLEAIRRGQAVIGDPASSAQQIQSAVDKVIEKILSLVKITTASTAPTSTASGSAVPSLNPTLVPNANAISYVKLSQKSLRLVKGKSVKLTSYGYTVGGKRVKVKWSSSKKSVAVVSAGRVRAKKAGKTVIRAKISASRYAQLTVKVVAKKPQKKGSVKKVRATGIPRTMKLTTVAYAVGKYAPSTATGARIRYTSANPNVVHIDAAGRLWARSVGSTYIRVWCGSKSKRYPVKVVKQ